MTFNGSFESFRSSAGFAHRLQGTSPAPQLIEHGRGRVVDQRIGGELLVRIEVPGNATPSTIGIILSVVTSCFSSRTARSPPETKPHAL